MSSVTLSYFSGPQQECSNDQWGRGQLFISSKTFEHPRGLSRYGVSSVPPSLGGRFDTGVAQGLSSLAVQEQQVG